MFICRAGSSYSIPAFVGALFPTSCLVWQATSSQWSLIHEAVQICLACRGSHWRKYGPLYLILLAIPFIMADLTRHVLQGGALSCARQQCPALWAACVAMKASESILSMLATFLALATHEAWRFSGEPLASLGCHTATGSSAGLFCGPFLFQEVDGLQRHWSQ